MELPKSFSKVEATVADALISSGIYRFAGEDEASPRLSGDFFIWLFSGALGERPVYRIENVIFPDPASIRGRACDCHFEFVACTFMGELDLRHVRVRQFDFSRSVFKAPVRLNGAQIERGIIANYAVFQNLIVQASELGGNLELEGATITEPLKAYQVTISKSLFIRDGARLNGADLRGAKIGTDCQFRKASISGILDLSSAEISGELQFGKPGQACVEWTEGAELSLENARSGVFSARLDDFRQSGEFIRMSLAGFSFGELDTSGDDSSASLIHEPSSKLLDWLKAATPSSSFFSGKPYLTFADALSKAGQYDKAKKVKIGLGWRETSREGGPWISKLGRFLSGFFVGFGYAPSRAITLFLGVFSAGAVYALWLATQGNPDSSFADLIVPALRLSLENSAPLVEFANPVPTRACTIGEEICIPTSNLASLLFDLQKLFSLILVSYFIAAITGFASDRRASD
ncbi:hypothetical protein [Ponticaulis sp.]|uniref:hypothetical protein n=1 Tax=Ponticaulis sp. TaxID=2020902 RepID=UPI000B68C790|nr:hypothetical protein [Ponticaulis sp.]MAJ09987.1 hypothetical protein [Ponticaulis sp.]